MDANRLVVQEGFELEPRPSSQNAVEFCESKQIAGSYGQSPPTRGWDIEQDTTIYVNRSRSFDHWHWKVYRKYHRDGSWTEILVKDRYWWRWLKVMSRRYFRKFIK